MATPQLQTQQLHDETLTLRPEERERLKKRRQYVKDYDPPKWRSSQPDPVSGQLIERPMVPHANIVFIGPTGSGKSSLIGSLVRAVTEVAEFPARIQMTLNHPGEDSHGTIMWLETRGNRKESILYQDTRGDQEYDQVEQSIHEFELQGMYRDGAELKATTFFSKDWWLSRRFFWEQSLAEVPHCVVFVFDGSSDPFLDQESLEFFQQVFKDCTNHVIEDTTL
ncbi:hypothetical protein GBAR_LOCUS26165 [Geodia barretti]|uniref:Uncharacterized protein n=1 Tax=Geodia barretti TaxID=519541 RepID=A0AA35X7S6_GEOBA|nr:hypothetical protein GBAR_LOCUS26165 [Geodia barretti]